MFGDAFRGCRVLVTGGTGFKGSWLCHWLDRLGARVTCLGLPPTTTPNLFSCLALQDRMECVMADVRDAEALGACVRRTGPDIVFHLAAQPLVRLSYQAPKLTFDTNVGGVVNLLEAIRCQSDVQACVVVTSDKVYESVEWPWGYRETDALGGRDPYSASKSAAEIVVASYRHSYFDGCDATRIATARAGNVIGGGDWSVDRIVPDFVRTQLAGRPLVLRHPAAVRPWQHVLEPLSGYLWLAACLLRADGQRLAEAWNFGPSDEGCQTVRELAELLRSAWGRGMIELSQAASPVHESAMLKLDCSKARAGLGWHGVWTLAEAVRHTVNWYRGYHEYEDVMQLADRQVDEYWRTAAARGVAWSYSRQTMAAVA